MNPHADIPLICVYRDGKDYGKARRVDTYANARSKRIMAQDVFVFYLTSMWISKHHSDYK
jgi:hypothetical protein